MKRIAIATVISLALATILLAANATQNPHGKLQWECYDCHNTTSWTSFKEPMTFQHDKTGFPLVGRHGKVDCGNCHKDLKFSMIGSACADCHPDIHRAQFGTDCENCHTPKNWADNKEIINLHASNGFPLVGVHAIADCDACHIGQQNKEYAGTPVDCKGCHESNFTSSTDPNHNQAGFSSDCQKCHLQVASSWKNTTYQHPAAFALHGGHLTIGCNSCHTQGFTNTSSDCYSCHQAQFNATTNPTHAAFGFPTTCAACHNDVSWQGTQFDHVQASQFALNGAHATALCTSCHINNQLTGLARDCYGCHQRDFSGANNPDHVQGNFPQTCLTCHNENAWSPATFDHSQSRFPLTGAHTALQCQACHANGYQNTPFDCFSCHQTNYNGATNPNHVQNNFDHNCAVCHSTSAWSPSTFNHNNTTFPLTGAHTSIQCVACHSAGYQNTPTDCYSCHQAAFNGVSDPNHVTNNFNHDCTQCHNTSAWTPATFDHANTRFPLTGAHIPLQCIACHANGYQNTPYDCYSCHANDFNNATDPNHIQNNFSHDCTQCHNTSSWSDGFNHSNLGFPLTGAHTSLQCIACHANGYQNTPADCYSCHEAAFNAVTDPNHVQNNFNHDCTLCHSTTSWSPATFDHSSTTFPLTGAHTSVQCIACHANGYQNTPTDCYSCHEAAFIGVSDPNHVTNNFDHNCTICHTTTGWSPATFDHNGTAFPLTGAHISLQCIACHANGYQNTPTDCWSCHQAAYNGATDPNHVQNNFDHNCTICHSTTGWSPSTFNHNNTAFPLTGAHISLQCIACHANGYQNTPTDCWSCHSGDYNRTTDPNHVQNNFSHDCTQCHNTSRWDDGFNHGNLGFPLTGAHSTLQCIACHANGYINTPADCYSCHETAFIGVTDPNHVQNNFNHDCTQCHTTNGWTPATFDHAGTPFPLTGAHVSVQCVACHANGYQNTPTDCYACHQTAYDGVTDPNHVQNNFNHDCTQCHTTNGWTPATFDHSGTPFPLTGAHVSVQCIACHANGYQNTPTDCYSCHQTAYNGVTDPNHVQNNFDHNCTICHTTTGWSPSTFNHANTPFPLTGAHTSLQCVACHANGYQNTPTDCYSCHQTAYNGVTDPNHVQNNFDHNCTTCHTTSGWSPATFDHSNTTFPLTGAHTSLQCVACHANGYQNIPTDCYSCHQTAYNGVTDPNHVQNNFDHNCTICHTTTGWSPATFDHSNTTFPLTGAHTSLQCVACHANGYQNIPTDCYSCHQTAYNGVTDPNHVSDNFSYICTQCHTTTGWSPATFNHNQTSFPLTGAHVSLQCLSCHANGFDNTPTDCFACHQSDFNGATNPNHQSAGFPTQCVMCHNTSAWSPSTFNHDAQYFPIYSGNHRGRWSTCSQCHTNPSDFSTFECILCHEHNRTDTDSHHQGVPGYQYNSQACYNCHPRGSGG